MPSAAGACFRLPSAGVCFRRPARTAPVQFPPGFSLYQPLIGKKSAENFRWLSQCMLVQKWCPSEKEAKVRHPSRRVVIIRITSYFLLSGVLLNSIKSLTEWAEPCRFKLHHCNQNGRKTDPPKWWKKMFSAV